ncbi:MAG TPA: hypothetical protein VGB20_00315 [bacterium]
MRIALAGLRMLGGAPVKLAVLLVMWTGLFGGMYALAHHGIRFLNEQAGFGPFLLSRLWYLFLFVIMLMLAISQLASAFSTLVRAQETRAWMLMPVSARDLCRVKWMESSVYSSWAVLGVLLPVCLAYLHVLGKPAWLAAWMVLALGLPLLSIVTAVSTLALFLWLRFASRIVVRKEMILVWLLVAGIGLFWLLGEQQAQQQEDAWFLAMQALLPRMRLAMSMWLPSSWMATALDAIVNGREREAILYTALLWTTAGVVWRVLDHVAAGWLMPLLRRHAEPVVDGRDRGIKFRKFRERWWSQGAFRAALAKDLLLLARDPMQWSQAALFFGLLGAYFANIHRLGSFSGDPSWRVGIAALNFACTLLVLGALAVRFVFPQLSMESRSLWLYRLAPGGVRRLVGAKLALYGAASIIIIEGLLYISALRLGIPEGIRMWLAGVGGMTALSIVGLAVGMGGWRIQPRAENSAQVVSSSDGAMVLVIMIAYVSAVVFAMVLTWQGIQDRLPDLVIFSTTALLLVSVFVGWMPVLRGLHTLHSLES